MNKEVFKVTAKMALMFGGVMALFLGIPMYFSIGLVGGLVGVPIGLMSGVLFGVIMYFFLSYTEGKMKAKEQELGIDPKDFVFQGLANHFRGMEAVGGKLYLTETHLKFMSHAFNIQNHEWEISLAEIEKVEKAKSLGLLNNRLNIFMKNGKKEAFTLNAQQEWYEKLTQK